MRETISRFSNQSCTSPCCTSRRGFLVGAMAATSALAIPGAVRAQMPAQTAVPAASIAAIGRRQVVDVHHHFVPPAYLRGAHDVLAQTGAFDFPPYAHWTPEATLAEMDRNNVATAMLSISTPGVWFGDSAAGRSLARTCNDYGASLVADHPGRFGLFAAIPLPDTEGSLTEIAYAMDQIHADGIGLMTSYGDKWLGDPSFRPVFEELNRRSAVVFVHPASPACCSNLMPTVQPSQLEFPTDTARTILSLLYGSVFRDCRNIRFIFCHNGGTLPVLVGRIVQLGHTPSAAKLVPPDTIPAELARHFYETANSANRASIGAMRQLVPVSQMLFGSDYPYVPVGATENGLLDVGLTPADLQAIFRENAVQLLPRLSRA